MLAAADSLKQSEIDEKMNENFINSFIIDLKLKESQCDREADTTEQEIVQIDLEIIEFKNRLHQTKLKKQQCHERCCMVSKEIYQTNIIRDAIYERINSLHQEQMLLSQQLDTMKQECIRIQEILHSFMQINVINDAFYIWYTGPYATINNFRVGNLLSKPVEWNEINAALGQMVLALAIVAQKSKYEFRKYSLLPMGNYSKIIKYALIESTATTSSSNNGNSSNNNMMDIKNNKNNIILSLYTDGSFSLFPKRNFNAALTGYLTCLEEFGNFTKTIDPTLSLPYVINVVDGKIHDQNLLLGGSTDEEWTRAMKFLLTDIKWIVAWASKHCRSSNNNNGDDKDG